MSRAFIVFVVGSGLLSPRAHDLSAQEAQGSGRPFSVAIARSVASAMSANEPVPCTGSCPPRRDVLASVSLLTFELEMAFPLIERRAWGVEYRPRAVPLAMAGNNPTSAALWVPALEGWVLPDGPSDTAMGVGLEPAGLRVRAGPRRLHVHADAATGFLFFGSPMLAANATKFNFSLEVGLGASVAVAGGSLISGWRWHHLSNAGFGEVNPGLNSHVVYFGFQVR